MRTHLSAGDSCHQQSVEQCFMVCCTSRIVRQLPHTYALRLHLHCTTNTQQPHSRYRSYCCICRVGDVLQSHWRRSNGYQGCHSNATASTDLILEHVADDLRSKFDVSETRAVCDERSTDTGRLETNYWEGLFSFVGWSNLSERKLSQQHSRSLHS